MAKSTRGESRKVTFGKRKTGQPGGKKSYNKHTPRPKQYRGQGRGNQNDKVKRPIKGR